MELFCHIDENGENKMCYHWLKNRLTLFYGKSLLKLKMAYGHLNNLSHF